MMKKLVKKIAVAMTVASLAVGALGISACANDTMYVNSTIGVNVRTQPDAGATKLGAMENGHAVDVVNYVGNGWVEINYNGQRAYCVDCLTSQKPANYNAQSQDQSGTHDENQSWINFTNSWHTSQIKAARGDLSHDNDTFTATVKAGFLALRSTPYSSAGNIIGQINNGDLVQVQQYGSQFDYVYVPALNQYGYVNNDYLF